MKQLRILALAAVAVFAVSTWTMAQDQHDRAREAYQAGMQKGREDANHDVSPMPHPEGWAADREQRAFEAGYDRGYDEAMTAHGGWADRQSYKEGMRQGKMASEHGAGYDPHPGRWKDEHERRAFVAGYNRGFHETKALRLPGFDVIIH